VKVALKILAGASALAALAIFMAYMGSPAVVAQGNLYAALGLAGLAVVLWVLAGRR